MTIKQIGLATASIALLGLVFYGKYRLAVAKPTLLLLFGAGLVFALTTPAQGTTKDTSQ